MQLAHHNAGQELAAVLHRHSMQRVLRLVYCLLSAGGGVHIDGQRVALRCYTWRLHTGTYNMPFERCMQVQVNLTSGIAKQPGRQSRLQHYTCLQHAPAHCTQTICLTVGICPKLNSIHHVLCMHGA